MSEEKESRQAGKNGGREGNTAVQQPYFLS